MRNIGAYKFAKQVLTAPQNLPSEWARRSVIIYYGPAGAGKSRRVRDECFAAGKRLWVAPIGASGVWHDGYDGHDAALFDDYRGGVSFADLLCILEGNRLLVPVKGSFVTFAPSVVYFTSDRHWEEWTFGPLGTPRSPLSADDCAQLARRISRCERLRPAQTPLNGALGLAPALLNRPELYYRAPPPAAPAPAPTELEEPGGGNTDPPQAPLEFDVEYLNLD